MSFIKIRFCFSFYGNIMVVNPNDKMGFGHFFHRHSLHLCRNYAELDLKSKSHTNTVCLILASSQFHIQTLCV